MNTFDFDSNGQYLIYGAGGNGINLCEKMISQKFNIKGIIDIRAKAIDKSFLVPIWTVNEVLEELNFKENVVVIITVKNVFEHEFIAKRLFNLGFENIVYFPRNSSKKNIPEQYQLILDTYNEIVEKNALSCKKNIPKVTERNFDFFGEELLLSVNKTDESICCLMPVELIYNYKDAESRYMDIPMIGFFPLVNLYKLFMGKADGIPDEIINDFLDYSAEWVEKKDLVFSEDLKKSMINSRMKIFNEMSRAKDMDERFFAKNAPCVKLEDGLRFNLISSGRNRVAYQIAVGKNFIPTKMTESDYKKWVNENQSKCLIEFLEEYPQTIFFSTIPHPRFISWQVKTTQYIQQVVQRIVMYALKLKQKNRKQISIYCQISDNGHSSRILADVGMKIYRKINLDSTENLIKKHLDNLLYANKENLKECKVVKKSDISILDNKEGEDIIFESLESTRRKVYLIGYNDTQLYSKLKKKNEKLDIQLVFETIWGEDRVSFYEIENR